MPAKPPPRRVQWPAFAFLAYIAGAALTSLLLRRPGPMLAFAPAFELPALPAVVIAAVLLVALAGEALGALRARRAK